MKAVSNSSQDRIEVEQVMKKFSSRTDLELVRKIGFKSYIPIDPVAVRVTSHSRIRLTDMYVPIN